MKSKLRIFGFGLMCLPVAVILGQTLYGMFCMSPIATALFLCFIIGMGLIAFND
jgi:hypothetical protein